MEITRAIPAASGPEEGLCAVVVSGPDAGRRVTVDQARLVGTSDVCDLKLKDRTVSRRHLSLRPSGVGVRARDLESSNGTWLGDSRVFDAEIAVDAEIRIGGTALKIERTLTSAEATAEPRPIGSATFGRFVGQAPCLAPIYECLDRAATSDATVLIEGESGTGKEVLAEAIHEASPRRAGPFMVVDCGAVSDTLIEAELFGHERGAFTGAERARAGAFEAADSGTVFLDEIGELSLGLQTRLLRVLDRGQIKRLGDHRIRHLDVRIIAATNRNLDREVEQSRFRLDLFHRLAVVLVRVPPLREREGDIELLARHFVQLLGGSETLINDDILARMHTHKWPGNARELRNYIERLALLGEAATGQHEHLTPPSNGLIQAATSDMPYRQARAQALETFTEAYVESMLARHNGNVSHAAKAAGVARRYFQRLKQGS